MGETARHDRGRQINQQADTGEVERTWTIRTYTDERGTRRKKMRQHGTTQTEGDRTN